MALKLCVVACGILKLLGDTVIEVIVGVLETVREAVPLMEPEAAVMVTEPCATPLAAPLLLIVASVVLEELQVTLLVRFWVLPSLYRPVAVKGCVPFSAIVAVAGEMAIEVRVLAPPVTIKDPVPATPPEAAVMVTVPAATPLATPLLLMVAMAVLEELQLTELRVGELPSV